MEWVRGVGLRTTGDQYVLLFTVQLVSEAMKSDDRAFRIESD